MRKMGCRFIPWLLLILIMMGQSPIFGAPESASFTFVQITDTHFGEKDNSERTVKVVEAISKLPMKIGFIAHTGDITADRIYDPGVVKDFKETMGRLNLPVYYAAGNHDILSYDSDETYALFSQNFNPPLYKTEYNGVVCLFVYLGSLPKNIAPSGGTGLDWVEQELKKAEGKPVIIFHHIPMADDFYNNRFSSAWPELFKQKWVELINAYHVKAVIAGHFHRDEFHWLGRVPLFVSASVAGYWKRQATYRIYEYKDGQVSYRTQYVE